MSTQIIPRLNRIEIDVFYDGILFLYNRRVNGQAEVIADRIAPERARQIIEAHASGDTYQSGPIDFCNPRPFSWTVNIMEAATNEQ